MNSDRRSFVKNVLLFAGASAAIARVPVVMAMSKLREADPEAIAIGYHSNASRVDRNKYPSYERGQRCANCALSGFSSGMLKPCKLVPGKLVNGGGWCTKWQKKT